MVNTTNLSANSNPPGCMHSIQKKKNNTSLSFIFSRHLFSKLFKCLLRFGYRFGFKCFYFILNLFRFSCKTIVHGGGVESAMYIPEFTFRKPSPLLIRYLRQSPRSRVCQSLRKNRQINMWLGGNMNEYSATIRN